MKARSQALHLGIDLGECLLSLDCPPGDVARKNINESSGSNGVHSEHLQMTRNTARSGFKAPEEEHSFKSRVSFNFLNCCLYRWRKVINTAVLYGSLIPAILIRV